MQTEFPVEGAFHRINPKWIDGTVRDLFPTDSSWQWFYRNHRHEMAESGELIVRGGSGGSFAGPGLRAVVLRILRRETLWRWPDARGLLQAVYGRARGRVGRA